MVLLLLLLLVLPSQEPQLPAKGYYFSFNTAQYCHTDIRAAEDLKKWVAGQSKICSTVSGKREHLRHNGEGTFPNWKLYALGAEQ
jgi:hypothetical protein